MSSYRGRALERECVAQALVETSPQYAEASIRRLENLVEASANE